MYKVCWRRISRCEEDEEYIVEKKVKGKQHHLPYNIRLLGRISIGEEGGNFGKENQDLKKKWGWGRTSSSMQLCTALLLHSLSIPDQVWTISYSHLLMQNECHDWFFRRHI